MIFSSANIPAVSCAITADLPSRCHQRNQATGRAAGFGAFSGGQKPHQSTSNSSPIPRQALDLFVKV
ncbi:MAG TPA: hypothetical protein VGM09_03855, partial [Bradyrhizobium sp.]